MNPWIRYLLIGAVLAAAYLGTMYGVRYGACVTGWSPLAPPAHRC